MTTAPNWEILDGLPVYGTTLNLLGEDAFNPVLQI
jgi:hypothetical protein